MSFLRISNMDDARDRNASTKCVSLNHYVLLC